MTRRSLLLFALAVFLIPLRPLAGADTQELADKARMLLDYQSFMRGDRDGGVRFTLSASRDLQGTPLAELAVRIALVYEPSGLSNVNVGEVEARRILSSETELSPEHRDALRRFVARSFATSGRRQDAMDLHRRRGLAMSWLVAGPFSGLRGSINAGVALPEGGGILERDVIADPPDAAVFQEWRKNPPWRRIPENRAFPFVRPWRGVRPADDGSMLLFTSVMAEDADNKAAFHVYSEASWQLYADGALIAEVDRTAGEAPVEHLVSYPLSPGRHTVTFQVFPPPLGVDPGDIRVALRLETTSSISWDCDAVPPGDNRAANARREARPLRYIQELRRLADADSTLMAAYSMACFEQRMFDTAAWWAEKAARANSDNPGFLHLAGVTTAANPLLPEERRRDIAIAWHRAALAGKPDLVPSLLYMAKVASGSGKAREAAEFLERAYAVNPGSLDVLMARGEWARRFASGATSRAAWDECGKAFPSSSAVQMAIATMPRDGFLDMDRRLAACRAAVEAGPFLADARLMLAEALAESGSSQEAEHVLRGTLELFDGDVPVLVQVAGVYARLGMYGDATAILSGVLGIVPDNDVFWRRLGDVRMEAGDRDEAEKYWRVSLAAHPGQFELSDMLEFLSGAPVRPHNEGDNDAIAMTARADTERHSADVVRLLDRSVVSLVGDGSFRRLTHEIDLARTRTGGESLTGIDNRGELLTARIVFPNGNTLEPEPFPGQGGLRLPVIMPGASRELRVLESIPADAATPTVAPWYFQDPSGEMPLLVSEYVVRTPKNFPLVHVVRNLGSQVDFEFAENEHSDTYRWTAALSLPSREPDAVHVSERIPSVEIGIKTTWEEVASRQLRRLEGRLVPSMRMKALLTSLYQPFREGRPDPLQAARTIYRYVCDNIDPGKGGDVASHVLADQLGDRRLLLLALLRAAGLDAYPAAARPSSLFMHPPTWELPSMDIFTVPMVRLVIPGGGVHWLDVRFDSLPFGKITDDLSGATVLSLLPSGPLFETLPNLPAEESIVYKERTIRLPAYGGDVDVSGRSLRRGVSGLARDQELAGADASARRIMLLSSVYPIFPDAVLKRFEVQRTDDSEASSLERYEITSKFPLEDRPGGVRAVSLCLFPPKVISTETRNMASRRTACHIKTVHMAEDRNVFRLPPEAAFGRLPRPAHIPSRFGVYQLRVAPQGDGAVEVIRNYHIPAQRIMPWDWTEFLDFLERVDLAEKQWIEYSVVE